MTSWLRVPWVARLWRPRLPQQAFLRLFELGLAFVALLGVQKMGTDIGAHDSALLTTGLVLLLLAHVLVMVECLRPSRLPWLITVCAMVGIVLTVAGQLADGYTGPLLWRIDAWLGVPLAFLAIIHPRGPKLPLLAVTGVTCLLALAGTGQLQWGQHLLATFFTAVQLALIMLARWFAEALLDEHLESLADRQLEVARDQSTQDRAEALASVRRSMHDSLLHCLQRISALWHSSTPEQIRLMCADTRHQLSTVPASPSLDDTAASGLGEGLRRAVAAEPASITWVGDGTGIPRPVAQALEGAVGEAVRNVVKHCDEATATISIRGNSQGVRVLVTDHGPGFDATVLAKGRSGLSESVVGRMADVGGLATVDSSPSGTTVTLTWPAPMPPATPGLGRRARFRQSLTPLPLVAGSAVNVSANTVPDPTTAWVAWTILVVIMALASWTVRRRGLKDTEAWLLCVLGLSALITNLFWIDPATTSGWHLWVPSLTGCLMFLALPGRSMATAARMAAMMLGGSLAACFLLLGSHATLVTHFGAVMAVLTHVLFTLVLAFGTAGVSRHVHVTRQQEAAVRARARSTVEREGVWQEWLLHARALTDGFLGDIAEGRADPTSSETRTEAAALEARIRDELRLWPGPHHVAAELDRLRRQGWSVLLDIDSPTNSVREDLATVLPLLPAPRPGQRMTITSRHRGAVITFSDPGLSPEQQAGLQDWVTVSDDDFTQLRTGPRPVLEETR